MCMLKHHQMHNSNDHFSTSFSTLFVQHIIISRDWESVEHFQSQSQCVSKSNNWRGKKVRFGYTIETKMIFIKMLTRHCCSALNVLIEFFPSSMFRQFPVNFINSCFQILYLKTIKMWKIKTKVLNSENIFITSFFWRTTNFASESLLGITLKWK